MQEEVEKQREYYENTAAHYDDACCFDPNDEHHFACAALSGLLRHYHVESVLDVGCGTGRAIDRLQKHHPEIAFTGLEPVKALRDLAVEKGIPAGTLLDGDATKLPFPDGAFDCVMMFGVLHHIPNAGDAVAEALRVAAKLVFISDHNIYGMGSRCTRFGKQIFRDLGLRGLLRRIMTGGKGYHDTDWDGVFYPFSLIDHVPQIRKETVKVHCFSTKTPAVNLYRQASHLAVLGLKKAAVESVDGEAG